MKTELNGQYVFVVLLYVSVSHSHSFLMYPCLNMASRKTMSLKGERSRITPWP